MATRYTPLERGGLTYNMSPLAAYQIADNVSGTDYNAPGLPNLLYRGSKAVGDSARKGTIKSVGDFAGSVLDKGPFIGAAATGGTAYLGGLGLGYLADALGLTSGAARDWSNYAGLAGLLGGGVAGHLRTAKSSSALSGIIQAVESDGAASYQLKQAVIAGLMSLGATQQNEVARAVMSVGAGSVVAILAKLLVGMGVLPAAILGLVSAFASNNLYNYISGPASNVDALGRPYYV